MQVLRCKLATRRNVQFLQFLNNPEQTENLAWIPFHSRVLSRIIRKFPEAIELTVSRQPVHCRPDVSCSDMPGCPLTKLHDSLGHTVGLPCVNDSCKPILSLRLRMFSTIICASYRMLSVDNRIRWNTMVCLRSLKALP